MHANSKVIVVLSAITLSVTGAHATTLHVASQGFDHSACGAKNDPCRSIGQGIRRASQGDTVVVGPGLYGDLDDSGVIGDSAGEENGSELSSGCRCVIKLDRYVTVVSSHGAHSTVIDGSSSPEAQQIVRAVPGASWATFGKRNGGFTITARPVANDTPPDHALAVDAGVEEVTVAGNVASGFGGIGYFFQGSRGLLRDNVADGAGAGDGYSVHGDGNHLLGNAALNAVYGFFVSGAPTLGHTVAGNVAAGNVFGFGIGIAATAPLPPMFSRNTAVVGRGGIGVFINASSGAPATTVSISKSNLQGQYCGIEVENESVNPLTVNAVDSYWGAASGPGPLPASDACVSPFNEGPVTMTTTPFAAREIGGRLKPMR
jgi:hypothetical protein